MTHAALGRHFFEWLHAHHLVYNACWEDPRLDRAAMRLGADDTVVMITSGGCNALDYALDEPRWIAAVDVNPRQNALLELKQAGIRRLAYPDFFDLFGRGRSPRAREMYRDALREDLSPSARRYWDRRIGCFLPSPASPSFYFHGTTGRFARGVNLYLDHVAKVRDAVTAILHAGSLDEQREIYVEHLRGALRTRVIPWLLRRGWALAFLGVPGPQRDHLEREYGGGIAEFVEEHVESVFVRLPLADNYFWRVYLTGAYSNDCCPEYLVAENFARLKAGLVDRITPFTGTVAEFLERHDARVSRFVLLDHMDWYVDVDDCALPREWQAIVDRAAPGARVLWRSGGRSTGFVDAVTVSARGRPQRLADLLTYARDLAASLHQKDRVHTYASFHIADLACA
jgi:S-adenosylmethionine-diacylglycerol 3-amino-3-carboxypropyl transferase